MSSPHAADAYLRSSIENAPPLKIVRLLYQGALRFLDQALAADPKDPKSPFTHLVGRADAIVTELRLAIDHSVGSDVTRNLERLYLFCEDQLGRAGLERSHAPLVAARDVLVVLLDAWKRVEVDPTPAA